MSFFQIDGGNVTVEGDKDGSSLKRSRLMEGGGGGGDDEDRAAQALQQLSDQVRGIHVSV